MEENLKIEPLEDLRNQNALLKKRILFCNQITFTTKESHEIMFGFMCKNSAGDVMDCEVVLLPDTQVKQLYEWLKSRYEGKEG